MRKVKEIFRLNLICNMSTREILKIGKSSSLYKNRPLPDWKWIHQELKKKSVTLELLFEEYKSIYPDGYEKSQFNFLYNQWKKKLNLSMR